jgi:hypothetical protein
MILRKSLLIIVPSLLLSMSVQQVNEASDSGLGCIKGIGSKRLNTIREYKKNHSIKKIDDLLNIQGIGYKTVDNIKHDIFKKSCRKNKRKLIPTQHIKRKIIKAK